MRRKKTSTQFCVDVFCSFLVFAALVGENLVKGEGYAPNSADDDENAQHSNAHIAEVVNKIHRVDIHCVLLLELHKEVEDETACDNRCDLTRYVYADRLHKKEVLGVFLKSHFVYDTT